MVWLGAIDIAVFVCLPHLFLVPCMVVLLTANNAQCISLPFIHHLVLVLHTQPPSPILVTAGPS